MPNLARCVTIDIYRYNPGEKGDKILISLFRRIHDTEEPETKREKFSYNLLFSELAGEKKSSVINMFDLDGLKSFLKEIAKDICDNTNYFAFYFNDDIWHLGRILRKFFEIEILANRKPEHSSSQPFCPSTSDLVPSDLVPSGLVKFLTLTRLDLFNHRPNKPEAIDYRDFHTHKYNYDYAKELMQTILSNDTFVCNFSDSFGLYKFFVLLTFGLANDGKFGAFLTKGLYDPRILQWVEYFLRP